ncbi:MAG: carbonic anhydrase [Alphaproteobacteria bacterium]|nr:carbonic anhydrase [Alphaproteobacteria bacterium]
MSPKERLFSGFRQFKRESYAAQVEAYSRLAAGQRPRTMIIACSDSRVDPSAIFSAGPGELFVVRNVANLVPPFAADSLYHGTSAALEFAVTGLEVEQVVVVGHGQCGGIHACLEASRGRAASYFIGQWMEIAAAARDAVIAGHPGAAEAEQQRLVEMESIRRSLANLETFPFVREAVESRGMALDGAWFAIAAGDLFWLDRTTGRFARVAADADDTQQGK